MLVFLVLPWVQSAVQSAVSLGVVSSVTGCGRQCHWVWSAVSLGVVNSVIGCGQHCNWVCSAVSLGVVMHRYWQQNFPEDFTLVPELQVKMAALQQVVIGDNDTDLLEYLSQDRVCVCVCVCVCVWVCICVRMFVYVCVCLYQCTHDNVFTVFFFLPFNIGDCHGYHRPEEVWNLGGSSLHNGQLRRQNSCLSFDSCSAEDIAVILCAIDYKLFRRVPVRKRGGGGGEGEGEGKV